MLGFGAYDFLIYAGFLGVQYFLSTRKSSYWGAIIPILFVSWLSWKFITAQIESVIAYIVILLVGILFLSEQWSMGRKVLRNHEKNNS